ncbi:MAG: hypothetical protein LBI60_03675 [Bacteroidales bacterium]|jgi:hypothetical protein|nr:hypothetical protein [Bacteroidales bacterium]
MLEAPILMLEAPILMLGAPILMLKAPISMLKAPISMLKAPISMLEAPISMLKAPISMLEAPIFYQCLLFIDIEFYTVDPKNPCIDLFVNKIIVKILVTTCMSPNLYFKDQLIKFILK